MNEDTIKALAAYFTGLSVPFHSMGLSMGGDRKVAADKFFEVRGTLGITGWATAEEAETILKKGK